MSRHRRRIGFTLVELLVVIVIVGVIVALVLPGVRFSREAARRAQCGNHVKLLSLALQNYHDTWGHLPYGARNRTKGPNDEAPPTWGSSWLVAILPFCEAHPLYSWIDKAEAAGSDYTETGVRTAANNAKIRYLLCPSSPFPAMDNLGGQQLVLPSYVGIMGATDQPNAGPLNSVVDWKHRLVAGPYGGTAAGNGMLPINESIPFTACVDGTANTILVSEVADWYHDDAGRRFNPSLAVSNAGDGPHDAAAGWLAGTNLEFSVEQDGPAVPANRVCNITTISQLVGTNNRGGRRDAHPNWGTEGIGRVGLNNPLLSAHPGGTVTGYLDGHIGFLTNDTPLHILQELAIRDNHPPSPLDE